VALEAAMVEGNEKVSISASKVLRQLCTVHVFKPYSEMQNVTLTGNHHTGIEILLLPNVQCPAGTMNREKLAISPSQCLCSSSSESIVNPRFLNSMFTWDIETLK
jgi:hypothetical protein